MTKKNEQNETLKNAEHEDIEYFQELTPSTSGVKETGNSKTTDLEVADLGKSHGVKETLSYALGLNMEDADKANPFGNGTIQTEAEKTNSVPFEESGPKSLGHPKK